MKTIDSATGSDPLLLAGKIICIIIQGVTALGSVLLLLILGALLFFGGEVAAELMADFGTKSELPRAALAGIFVIGFAVLAALFYFFDRLRRIINTVGEGDPFAPINADRLSQMAWLSLGIQLLFLPAAGLGLYLAQWADEIENGSINIDAGLDLEGILIAIVLFILARVFRHGAAMREDLEGTV